MTVAAAGTIFDIPANCTLLDGFGRSVAEAVQPDLGVADCGQTWTWAGGGSDYARMGSGALTIVGSRNGAEGSFNSWALALGAGFTIPGVSRAAVFEFRFRVSFVWDLANVYTRVQCQMIAGLFTMSARCQINNVPGGIGAGGGFIDFDLGFEVPKSDWLADTWYTVRLQADATSGDIAIWVWPDGASMGAPLYTDAGTWVPSDDDGKVDLIVDIQATSGAEEHYGQTVDVDYIRMCSVALPVPDLVPSVDNAETWAGVRMARQMKATSMGGTPFDDDVDPLGVPGPVAIGGSISSLAASWDMFFPFVSQGQEEQEQRRWLLWAVPPDCAAVHFFGYAKAVMAVIFDADGATPSSTVEWQMGPIFWDGTSTPDWDNVGSGYGGSTPVTHDPTGSVEQTHTAVDFTVTSFGPPLAWGGDFPADWKSLAMSIACTSTEGIGMRTVAFMGSPPDGTYLGAFARFPNNPNWHISPDPDHIDYSEAFSSVVLALDWEALVPDPDFDPGDTTGGLGGLETVEVFPGAAHIGRSTHT